jgi:hypothetical protein
MIYQFWLVAAILCAAVIFFDNKYCMLRDISKTTSHQPYSWARVQLAWWTVIVLSSFIAIFWSLGVTPALYTSTVILLGISAATITTARVIDLSDQESGQTIRHQDSFGKNFFLDILSDSTGVSIHRFQTIVFNLVFGIYFISQVLHKLAACTQADCVNTIIPDIEPNSLILLGLSSATYAALKMTENKSASIAAENKIADTGKLEKDGSVG